jgi:hypothetical protein
LSQTLSRLREPSSALPVQDLLRQRPLTGEQQLAFPCLDECLYAFGSQALDPILIGFPALDAERWICESWMRGDDGGGAKTLGRGLNQTERDPPTEGVANDLIQAGREPLQ